MQAPQRRAIATAAAVGLLAVLAGGAEGSIPPPEAGELVPWPPPLTEVPALVDLELAPTSPATTTAPPATSPAAVAAGDRFRLLDAAVFVGLVWTGRPQPRYGWLWLETRVRAFELDGQTQRLEIKWFSCEIVVGAPIYTYDVFNRRIERRVNGQVHETVWSGWQEIEQLVDGQLESRHLYGLGLDEIVRIERDLDGDGTIDQQLTPLYDSTGNLAVVTNENGLPVERYDYTPYGERRITVDLTPPVVEQVRSAGAELVIEISEEVSAEAVAQAAAAGDFALVDTAAGEPLAIEVTQPVATGRQKGRRLIVTTTDPPAEGAEVRLAIETDALIDVFLNRPAEPFELTFSWPAADTILDDSTAPRVSQILVRDGRLEIELSEEPDLAAATAAITVEGDEVSWTLAEDGYTLVVGDELEPGSHQVTISTAPLDLAGLGLAQDFTASVMLVSGTESRIVYQRPDPREVASSTVGNRFGFHGRPVDPETGFVYARNRYMDPELARWLSPDPLGYVDGPNLYQGFLNDPLNNSDPLGLTVVVLWFGKGSYYGAGEGFEDLLGKLAEQAAARNQHYRTMAINDWERNRLYEIGRSTGYVESPESLKVIAVSDVKNDPRGRMDVLEKTLSELSPGEDIYIVGHSRGAHRATWFAKRLASKGVKVRGLVAVDFFQWFSSKRIPSNVEQFLAFYSAPSPETRERRTAEGSRHSPGSGASEFGLAPETVDYGVYSLDETHQAMDSNPFVHEKVLQLVGGTLRPPPEPTCWKCIELAFRLFYGVGGGGPDE